MKKIPLSQGKFAIVDNKDYKRVSKLTWILNKVNGIFYVVHRRRKFKKGKLVKTVAYILLHRYIMCPKNSKDYIDHKNHNGLDNRRCNLRICTSTQNFRNSRKQKNRTSKFKGVTYTNKNIWQASIGGKNGKFLGNFHTELEAGVAYNIAAYKEFGEFACLNKIPNWKKIKIRIKGGLRKNRSSQYKGVAKNGNHGTWKAFITYKGKTENLGYYSTEKFAGIAYNIKAVELYGNNTYLNNIKNWQKIKISSSKQKKSIYKGISPNQSGNWRVSITIKKVKHYFGTFKTEIEAAKAYNKAAKKLLGRKAKLNVIK